MFMIHAFGFSSNIRLSFSAKCEILELRYVNNPLSSGQNVAKLQKLYNLETCIRQRNPILIVLRWRTDGGKDTVYTQLSF